MMLCVEACVGARFKCFTCGETFIVRDGSSQCPFCKSEVTKQVCIV